MSDSGTVFLSGGVILRRDVFGAAEVVGDGRWLKGDGI
jgi:hypothetical protein